MKIVIFTPFISVNGLGKVASELSRILDTNGHDVTLVCRFDCEKKYPYKGKYTYFESLDLSDKPKEKGFSSFLRFYYSTIKEVSPDLVISIGPSYDIINVCFKRILKYRAITSIHNNIDESYSTVYKLLLPMTILGSEKVVPVSQRIEDKLKEKYKFLSSKIAHIPNPIDIEVINNKPVGKNLLYVGRLSEQKAVWHIVSAIYLSKSKPTIYILGDGEQRDMLIGLIDKLGVAEQVVLKGFVSNVDEYLESSRYLVLTSLFEGFPMVLLESLAKRTPVLSVDCDSGPSEIICIDEKTRTRPGELLKSHALPSNEYFELVKNGEFSPLDYELAKVFDQLDTRDYDSEQAACANIVDKFSLSAIGDMWEEVLNAK